MPAALEWDKVMGIDPVNIYESEKDLMDVTSMLEMVTATLNTRINYISAQLFNSPTFSGFKLQVEYMGAVCI